MLLAHEVCSCIVCLALEHRHEIAIITDVNLSHYSAADNGIGLSPVLWSEVWLCIMQEHRKIVKGRWMHITCFSAYERKYYFHLFEIKIVLLDHTKIL